MPEIDLGLVRGPKGDTGDIGPEGPQGPQGNPSTVNGKTADSNGAITLLPSDIGALPSDGTAVAASKLATARAIALSGDVSGSTTFNGTENASIATTLKPSGVTAGTYGASGQVPQLTVDAKGLVIGARNIQILPPHIGAASNPNLLDNWYFADPIDQRNGHIVGSGVTYYSDSALTASAGTTTVAMTAQPVNSTYGTITISGTTYYVAAADVVKGHSGTGYMIDRWYQGAASRPQFKAILKENGILMDLSNSPARCYWMQKTEIKAAGVFTLSLLFDNNLITVTADFSSGAEEASSDFTNGVNCSINRNTNPPFVTANFPISGGVKPTFIAAKLELGSQQTLAHQDASGNWVLNDPPPNKTLELAKCRRYFKNIGGPNTLLTGYRNYSIATDILCNIPGEPMRATPTVITDITPAGNIAIKDGVTYELNGADSFDNRLFAFHSTVEIPSGGIMAVNINCKLWLSADL